MGHACELETSFQMATRPHLVKMERLEGVKPPLVKWDLVAPVEPSRTYMSWPTAAERPSRDLRRSSQRIRRVGRAFSRRDRRGSRPHARIDRPRRKNILRLRPCLDR